MGCYKETYRLEEIRDEIAELVEEAEGIIRDFCRANGGGGVIAERARSYWVYHILGALMEGGGRGILGGSMFTMDDTIKDIREWGAGEE